MTATSKLIGYTCTQCGRFFPLPLGPSDLVMWEHNASIASHSCRPKALVKAVADLGAVEIAPGWYAFKRRDVEYYSVGVASNIIKAAKQVFHTCGCASMPGWWRPDRRTITRCKVCNTYGGGHVVKHPERVDILERITADLETGAEVPA